MQQTRYSASANVTLDANGNGIVTIPGPKPGQTILLAQVTVNVPTTLKIPKFSYYVGSALPPNLVSGSVTGNKDTDSTPNVLMYPGEFVTAVWTGGDPGAQATIVLNGVLTF